MSFPKSHLRLEVCLFKGKPKEAAQTQRVEDPSSGGKSVDLLIQSTSTCIYCLLFWSRHCTKSWEDIWISHSACPEGSPRLGDPFLNDVQFYGCAEWGWHMWQLPSCAHTHSHSALMQSQNCSQHSTSDWPPGWVESITTVGRVWALGTGNSKSKCQLQHVTNCVVLRKIPYHFLSFSFLLCRMGQSSPQYWKVGTIVVPIWKVGTLRHR